MTEFMQPKPDTGGFVDSVEARAALDEFKYISRMRGDAHAKANLFRDYHVSPEDSPDHPLRRKLQNLRGLLTRWALMQANQEFRTVDLARIENNGDWDATESAEVDMERLAIQEYEAGNSQGQILRNSPESKLRIMVDPTLLCANGLVVVRRKRLMLRTITTTSRFRDVRPRRTLNVCVRLTPRLHRSHRVGFYLHSTSPCRRYHRRQAPCRFFLSHGFSHSLHASG